jgi:hypothetical protein
MFDRTACADAEPLTAQPFVSIDAVYTENLIRVDDVMESPKLAE